MYGRLYSRVNQRWNGTKSPRASWTVGGHQTNAQRGFTIIEAMVSMVVLLVVVMSMIALVPASLGYAAESSTRIQAVGAAQDYLDTVRQYIKTNGDDANLPSPPVIPIDSGNGFFSATARPDLGNFSETPKCVPRSLFSFDCTVTVSWAVAGVNHSVKVESFVASQTGF